MIEVREVKTRKEIKEFLYFPLELYKDCEYYVPSLLMDEKKIFKKNYVYNETCDVVFFNAYKDEKIVGRISGIIQKASNEKWNQNRCRFTRFDSINDKEVSRALFDSVTKWAKDKGIEEVVGPLGYSDLEREGLLIWGFDQLGTYEEQYNYEYYQELIEDYGFEKEIDWVEYKLYLKERDEKFYAVTKHLMERAELRIIQCKTVNEFIKKYINQFFDILDLTYDRIYGTVPMTDKMRKTMVSNFKLLVRPSDVSVVLDKDDNAVGFALSFPSISEAVHKHKGKLTLGFIVDFLKAKKHPKVIDLGLIGVHPKYESKGIAAGMLAPFFDMVREWNIDHLETNLMLENNYHIQNLMKRFDTEYNKRRRCFIKKI